MTTPQAQDSSDTWLSDISAGYSLFSGLKSGGTGGALRAGLGASTLAGNAGLIPAGGVKSGLGVASNVLGAYEGFKQGGVGGDLAGAANTAEVGAQLGVTGAAEVAGPLVIASSVYNFAENWQSGKTGSDALSGAEAGAAIGTTIVPGIGTVVGAVIGGAVGALSSAFGGGATDPETKNWSSFIGATNGANATQAQVDRYTSKMPPQAAFNLLTGVMDIKDGRIPFVNAFGRMSESDVLNGMATQINAAIKAGKISPSATPQQMYSQVVTPWLNSKGATITPETGGLQLQGVLTSLIGSWQTGALTSKTQLTSTGSMDTTLPAYAGHLPPTPAAQNAAEQMATVTQGLSTFPGSSSSGAASLASTLPMIAGAGAAAFGASSMANPTNPTATGPQSPAASPGTDPNAGGAAPTDTSTGTGSSVLSTISQDLSSFLSSPAGTLTEFGTLAGLGLSQANAQKATNDQLAGGLTATGQPFTQAGQAELTQLEGGPAVGGPLGQSITDQTTAASELAGVAKTYGTGNLTSAQNTQVQQYVAQQQAAARAELAGAGITDPNSQEFQTRMQQIDDNAAVLSQQLETQNTTMATQALTAVQSTYSTLLNQSLSAAEFGFSTQEAGVQTQIQSDTQLAASLNSLFAGIAQGVGTAMRGPAGSTATPGATAAGAVGSAVGAAARGVASSASGGGAGGGTDTGGGTAANPTQTYDPSTGEWSSGFTPGGGSAPGTDYAPGVSAEPPPPGWTDPNANPFGSTFDTSGTGPSFDMSTDPFSG